MERVRLEAELTRAQRFQSITHKYAPIYYDVCQKLCDDKIDQKINCQFIMDYFKTLLEYGHEFSEVEYTSIYQSTRDSKQLDEDALRCFYLLAQDMELNIN